MRELKEQLTVAVPIFNEERYLRATVMSAVAQAGQVILLDNASTDKTPEICQDLVRQFRNTSYIRHSVNVGAINNFFHASQVATTPYLMFLGAHDLVSANYSEELLPFLQDPSVGLAFSRYRYVNGEGETIFTGDYAFASQLASSDPYRRVYTLIRYLYDCSLFHGIWRTEILRRAWFDVPCLGFDHVVLCRGARLGRLMYADSAEYSRRLFREEDSPAQQLERIQPGVRSIKSNPRQEMCGAQYAALCSVNGDSRVRRLVWREMGRIQLLGRFGYFAGAGPAEDWVNWALVRGIGLAKVLRKFAKSDRNGGTSS